jgi:hypothetical protein
METRAIETRERKLNQEYGNKGTDKRERTERKYGRECKKKGKRDRKERNKDEIKAKRTFKKSWKTNTDKTRERKPENKQREIKTGST